jgi:hypothetical protein
VTDASTKGLFPQLTDVLHALTESHARLLSKVVSLRVEQTTGALRVVNVNAASAYASIGEPTDLRPPQVVERFPLMSSIPLPHRVRSIVS